MGAGQRDDHYIQDAAEVYWVYIVQKELDSLLYSMMEEDL